MLLFLTLAALTLASSFSFQSSALSAQAAAASASDPELLRARATYEKGDTAAAVPLFLEVLHHTPFSYEANESLGLIHAEAGDFAKALPYFQAAAGSAPRQAVAHANLGAALLHLGKASEAAAELATAVRLDPKNPQGEANLARALIKADDASEAAQHFARSAALAPPDADLLYDWAVALYPTSPARATEVLARIPAAEMTDQVESLYGDAEEKQGHFPQAVAHLRHAAELAPSEQNIYALAVELLRHWSWQEAMQICNYGRALFPTSTRLSTALGVAQFGNANYQEAAVTFSALLAAAPDSALYGDMLGRTCDAMAESDGNSCALLLRFADAHPGNAQIDIYAASSILRSPQDKQDLTRASRLLDAAIHSDPKASEAYYQLGVLNQQQALWAESVSPLKHAIALRPTFAEAHYRLARAYFRLGDKDRGNLELTLQRQYQAEEKEALDRKLRDVTKFIFTPP